MGFHCIGIVEGSYNLNFLLLDTSGVKWVAKISKNLQQFDVDFVDLDDRAVLASRLAKLAQVKIPQQSFIRIDDILDSPRKNDVVNVLGSKSFLYDNQKILISRFEGYALPVFIEKHGLKEIMNLDELIRSFAFDLWIGNYDRKDSDYVVNKSGIAYSVDYNLFGMGFRDNDDLAIGYYARPYSIEVTTDSSYCIGKTLKNIAVEKHCAVDFFDPIISRIEKITKEEMSLAFAGLNFKREKNYENINLLFIDFLLKRQKLLRDAVAKFCEAGFPSIPKR